MAKKTVKEKLEAEELKAQSDVELIIQAIALHKLIYTIKCYGMKDIRLLELTYRELEGRGFKIKVKERPEIAKRAKI